MRCGILFILSFALIVHQSVASVEDIRFVGQQSKDMQELNFTELVNHSLYKQKYGHLPVEIIFSVDKSYKIFELNNVLRVGSGIAISFLMAFGKLIDRLSVSFIHVPDNELGMFGKLVSDHCAETLVELKCQFKDYDAFAGVKVPFKKVKSIRIEGAKNWTEFSLKIPDLFPEMRCLNLTDVNIDVFNHPYLRLREVNADIPISDAFGMFVAKNPQIETLRTQLWNTSTPIEFLRMVSKKLPWLTTLEFNTPVNESSSDPIHFENVKNVSIKNRNLHSNPVKLIFNHLNRLELVMYDSIDDEWVDFIGKNKDLQTLVVKVGYFNNATLSELSTKLHNLIAAEIRCCVSTDIDVILRFLESNKRLETLILSPFPVGHKTFFKTLREKFDTQWIITPMDERYFAYNITRLPPPIKIIDSLSSNQNDSSEAPTITGNNTSQGNGTSTISMNMTSVLTLFIAVLSIAVLARFQD